MKNKKKNKRIYFFLALIILFISLTIAIIQRNNNKEILKIGNKEFEINLIGTLNVDTSGVILTEPNAPQIRCRNDTN